MINSPELCINRHPNTLDSAIAHLQLLFYSTGSSSVDHRQAEPTLPVKTSGYKAPLRPSETETLGLGPRIWVSTSLSNDS